MANLSTIPRSRGLTLVLVAVLAGSLGWLVWQTWDMRFPENAFTAYGEFDYNLARNAAAAAGAVLIWRSKPPGWQFTLRNMMAVMLLVAFWLGTGEVYERRGSLLLGFRASRAELDAIADRAAGTGDRTAAPINQQAGWYQIESGQVIAGAVFLRTSTWWPMPNSGYGFIRIPNADKVSKQDLGLDRAGFFHLGGDWYVVYDLYKKGKFGWS